MKVPGAVVEVGKLLAAGLVGVILTVICAKPFQTTWDKFVRLYVGETVTLEEAASRRNQMTDKDLESAVQTYESLLRSTTDKTIRFRAYWGLSRAYADLANLRFWRGLSRSDYPDNAIRAALDAEHEMPGQFETALALAYGYHSHESYQQGAKHFPLTTAKVRELEAQRPGDPDVRYLSWLTAGAPVNSYTEGLHPGNISNPRVLMDVGMAYALWAEHETDATQRRHEIDRSTAFLMRAAEIDPQDAVVPFCRGYLAVAKGQLLDARDYYGKAIEIETEYPSARNNLGFVYAALGQYSLAKEQFEAASSTRDAPIHTQLASLRNLGEAYMELDNNDEACNQWGLAAQLPGSKEDIAAHIERAVCSFLKNDEAGARSEYTEAIGIGDRQGLNLRTTAVFKEEWKTGPRQLKIIDELIKLTTGATTPKPTGH